MAYTLTQDDEILDSGVSETVVVAQDSGGTNDPVSIAIDYTGYLARIATALETIAEQLTPITQEAQTERFADQIARLRYLADPNANEVDNDKNHGTGIRQSNPWGAVLTALQFEGLVQEGGILATVNGDVTDQTLQSFLDKISNRDNDQVVTQAAQRLDNIVTAFRSNATFNSYK
jgi:hypothetical protein